MIKRYTLRIVLLAALLTFGVQAHAQDIDSNDSEYLIKAGFIYNFAKLVDWPQSAFGQAGQPIVIGVLGSDSFASILDHIVDGKKIDGRPLLVKRTHWNKDFSCGCHILFITSSESLRTDEVIQGLRNASVLTIAESPGFAKRGGIINFTLEDNKVHFEVNVEAAKQAGLNISSRLLSLAKIVQARPQR